MKEILVGQIMGAHGIRGQVKVAVFSHHPETWFVPGKELWVEQLHRSLAVEQSQFHNALLLVKFQGIEDRSAAEALFKAELRVDKSDLPVLPVGQYYDFELIGLEVYADGQRQGILEDILETGANDVYVVKRPERPDLLIPAIPAVARQVDLTAGTVHFQLPEGLLECYE